MYGGRVSDSYDRRILNTYLDEYLGDFLFDTFQPFHFYSSKDCDISVPQVRVCWPLGVAAGGTGNSPLKSGSDSTAPSTFCCCT